MNIEKRKSRDGKKVHYLIAWGRGAGQRVATGIFTFANPENQEQKRYNKEALVLLEQKRAQMVLDQQSVGTGYIPAHKYKANFLDYMEGYVKANARIGNRHILESTDLSNGGLTNGTRYDVVRTYYDLPNNSHGLSAYTINDDNLWTLRNAVTMTEKYSSIASGSTGGNTNLISRTRYNYDEKGNVVWVLRYVPDLGYKSTDNTYDALGRLVKSVYQKGAPAETFVHYYEYNNNQQHEYVYTNTVDNLTTRLLQVHYLYALTGEVKRTELGDGLQGLDYTYLLDGSLKAINNSNKAADPGGDGSNGFLPDAFGMVLDYYANDYRNGRSGIVALKGVNTGSYAADSYTGNIKAMSWFSQKPGSVTGLDAPAVNVFKYDDRYRFIENTWGTGLNFANTPASFTATAYNKETIKDPAAPAGSGYDSHGNILYLQRTNTAGQPVDKFQYNYKANSNQLMSVVNSATGTARPYADYSYDALGQLTAENTADTSRRKYLRYDVTGKVVLVARDAAFTRKVAELVYDENGTRIAKKTYNASGQLIQTTWYIGGVIYTKTGTGSITPVEYAIDGGSGRIGTFYKSGNVYAYELRDQTGNVRAVIAKSGSSLEVRGYSDYYPYGMVLRSGGTNYRYGYQGAYAEKDGETDWNAFELRMYDSRIARWLTIDPKGQYASPYVGMGGDPVNGVDKDGGSTDPGDYYDDKTGNWLFSDGIDDGKVYIVQSESKLIEGGTRDFYINYTKYIYWTKKSDTG